MLAIVVVVAVAVLSSPVVPDPWPAQMANETSSTTAASTVTTEAVPPAVAGSGLLVVTQNGDTALVALFRAGPNGGVVLGMPGVTLLRSEDRFVRLADAYSPEALDALARPVAGVLGVPEGAVAAIEWSGLGPALAGAVSGGGLPEELDPQGADAGVLAAVLAAALNEGGSTAAKWWQGVRLAGDADGFRAALEGAALAAAGSGWTGLALTGDLVEYAAGSAYWEPDVQAARTALAGTGA